jgi:hypothetical protein
LNSKVVDAKLEINDEMYKKAMEGKEEGEKGEL